MINNIRKMQQCDWLAVSAIYLQGIKTDMATFQTGCPTYEEWDNAHVKSCRLVVLADGKVAGWAALSPVSSRCVYRGVAEVSVYIDTAFRGKKLGEIILNRLLFESEQKGFWTLQSSIMQDNKASIRLHEKCGFRMVGYREKIGQDHFGVWRNTVLMERRSTGNQDNGGDLPCYQK